MVGSTLVLPTGTVPEDILKKHIGNFIVVTGIWHPGEYWRATEGERSMLMPVDSEKEVITAEMTDSRRYQSYVWKDRDT